MLRWVTRCTESECRVGWADLYDGEIWVATAIDVEWWMGDDGNVRSADSHEAAKDATWAAVYRSTR